jgi:predicted ATPase
VDENHDRGSNETEKTEIGELDPNALQPGILLVEEPENGVHHASLKDIVGTLKQLTQEKGVQVILTTHSPYLLDHVEPQDVHVFRKDEEGAVHARRLSEYPDVQNLKKHFMTGEIWTGLNEEGA